MKHEVNLWEQSLLWEKVMEPLASDTAWLFPIILPNLGHALLSLHFWGKNREGHTDLLR